MEEKIVLKKKPISDENLKRLFAYIESIQFGTVTLIIQNGEVVQIEKMEKFKLK
ncbi:MAG TPA: YezD family protein [Anaerovoracaceae bacterium]|nr:YezD family protein [Anaerovoracaceae bacterium]